MSQLADLLDRHRDALSRYVADRARGLMRFESADDLVQGAHLRAIENEARFEYQGDEAFLGWIRTLARQHIADRHAHWNALKRRATKMLRVGSGSHLTEMERSVIEPAASMTGPVTFAQRREAIGSAMQALASLPERDQKLITWLSEGATIDETAERLEISYAAAERARLRAIERFRRAYGVLTDLE